MEVLGGRTGQMPVERVTDLVSLFYVSKQVTFFPSSQGTVWYLQVQATWKLPCSCEGIQAASPLRNANRSAGISTAIVSVSAQLQHIIRQDTDISRIRAGAGGALPS